MYGASENEMAGWHHRCNEHELGQTPGDGKGQVGLSSCSPWDRKESDNRTGQNGTGQSNDWTIGMEWTEWMVMDAN